ncbi:MAG: hypothetical protein JSS98_05760 [Bacteroidetes bacterium]|nr:hypothetical protein [Bacteroidota bacterium]
MQEPGREYSPSSGSGHYRYGFNGKENDNEVKGEGNQQDYGMRIYYPRLGRFLSVDPIVKSYPSLSPYQFASNRPIDGVDMNGQEYLNSSESKIDITTSYIEFNGQKVISGAVYLDLDKVSPTTKSYVQNLPWSDGELGSGASRIATFKHKDYQVLMDRITASYKTLFRQPDATDMSAKSLEQPLLEIPRIPSNKRELREMENSKQFTVPSGGGGSPVGDALVAAVQLTSNIIEYGHGKRIENDYKAGINQLSSVQKAINDVQFALDNNLIAPAYLNNLTELANYLLDGQEPKVSYMEKNYKGDSVAREYTNNSLLKTLQDIKSNILKKKWEIAKAKECSVCK